MRSRSGTLGDELELARAYLDLCKVRMGDRLAFAIDADPVLRAAAFPPMLLITLVENAIKHGLEPVGGGEIEIRAKRDRDVLTVEVLDDGAGFAAAGNGGTGVGLVNVQRQLAGRYAGQARLGLTARTPRGVRAALSIPLPERSTIRRGERPAA
jgi:LytS/YehU family sensor histidine kinase